MSGLGRRALDADDTIWRTGSKAEIRNSPLQRRRELLQERDCTVWEKLVKIFLSKNFTMLLRNIFLSLQNIMSRDLSVLYVNGTLAVCFKNNRISHDII